MSSWLDTKFLGSLAKTAIAEAQKTLDKALDIRDDEEESGSEIKPAENVPKPSPIQAPPISSGPTSFSKSFGHLGASNWGSFTGSFFEAAELGKETNKQQQQPDGPKRHQQKSKDMQSGMVSSISEPVSLQPTGSFRKLSSSSIEDPKPVDPFKPPRPQVTTLQPKASSSIMEASSEDDLLNLKIKSDGDGAKSDKEFVDTSILVPVLEDQVRTDPEGESESSLLIQGEVPLFEPEKVTEDLSLEKAHPTVSLSTVSSSSAVISSSSVIDDCEELNSSISSSQTLVSVGPVVTSNEESFFNSGGAESTSSILSQDETINQKHFQDSVITNFMLEEAMSEKHPSEEGMTSETEQMQINSEESDCQGDDKHRSESVAGSSKSFELLKMPTEKSGAGNSSGTGTGSGHTSGDDLETFTTTSSDIEVISSPGYSERSHGHGQGGGSPVTSTKRLRNDQCASKHFKKDFEGEFDDEDNFQLNFLFEPIRETSIKIIEGHFRTCSEISSISCQSENCDSGEIDRLIKKISELTEILEIRESKMVELSRSNLELQEQNVDLSSQVKEAMKINAKLSEANISSDEFTQRMANLEKKLQQVTAERDTLKEENKTLKRDRLCPKEVGKLLSEKDEIISDLREEGESLSRQAGKHSDIIKKLRSKEKSLEKELTSTKSSLEEKTKECERLKKSLGAKDEMESKQIDAIRELSSANTKWEEANSKMASDLEDAHEKANGLRVSLESAYKEIGELKRGLMEKEDEAREAHLQKEVEAREKLERQAREDQENFRSERDSLCREIDELRVALSANERSAARREEEMRRERQDLLQRLEQSEHRHEELSGSVSMATRPLLRQIESLQASLNETRTNCDRVEMSLTDQLQQTSLQLAAAQERERTASEQYRQVSSKLASLESHLQSLSKQKSELEAKVETESRKFRFIEDQRTKELAITDALKKSFAEEVSDLKKEKDILEVTLENEKTVLIGEQRKNVALVQQLKDRDKRIKEMQADLDLARTGYEPRFSEKSSPTPSLSQLSIGGSFSENTWPEEVFDAYSGGNGRNSVVMMSNAIYESGRAAGGSMATLLESLQAQLKQREGEIVQLQMEVAGLERVKEGMTQELGRLSQQSEQLHQLQQEQIHLRNLYKETEQKYQTMLTMYGEKVEEAEELRLDLQDVKEMYKIQIEEVLRTRNQN